MGSNGANMDKDVKKKNGVEGEGSYNATHRYNAGVEKSVRQGRTDELAKKAEQALDGKEGEELREAEARGKKGAIESPPPSKTSKR